MPNSKFLQKYSLFLKKQILISRQTASSCGISRIFINRKCIIFAALFEYVMNATEYIQKLGLVPHPEGGYYRQLFGNDETGEKPVSTIYYMLTANDMSAFHRLHNMVEIWYFHAGEPLNIYVIESGGTLTVHRLSEQDEMQVVIQPEQWFAADIPSKRGFCLVGCAVGPAFRFENFELAKKEELLKLYPQHGTLIERMCRE